MNITVHGAAGGTGMQVVQQALAAGYSVTALVRRPEKTQVTDPHLPVVQGDATDQASVTRAGERLLSLRVRPSISRQRRNPGRR